MENEFEKYLQQNKDRFETDSPSPRVWEKLERDLVEQQGRRQRLIRMQRISWGIAASILLCIGVTIAILKTRSQATRTTIVRNASQRDSMIDNQKLMAQKMELDSVERVAGVTDDKTRQSLYHYTKLIETRQKELATLRQVDPELYARSQKALIDLDVVYSCLKKQLPQSIDQQKILKSLIQNLKMQEQILNNQLQLLEELQTPEHTSDEKKVEKI
ncbi:MAG: hypothetical protein JWR09_1033 [Mucilaginibacter sp.]|nr:hypothetical protein [Mucilaginibacter sp.]